MGCFKITQNKAFGKAVFLFMLFFLPISVFAAGVPVVAINDITNIDCGLQATATINPNRAATSYHIEYQATGSAMCNPAYDSLLYVTGDTYAGDDGKDYIVSFPLSGLIDSVYYNVTVVAFNSYGSTRSLTWSHPIMCGIGAVTKGVTPYMYSAEIKGCVSNSLSSVDPVSSWFEWGILGNENVVDLIYLDGVSPPCYSTCASIFAYLRSVSISNLQPGVTYKYRVAIKDSTEKVVYSPYAEFKTISEMTEFDADYLYVLYRGHSWFGSACRDNNDIYKFKKNGLSVDYPYSWTGEGEQAVYGCSWAELCQHSCAKALSPDMRGNIYTVNSGEPYYCGVCAVVDTVREYAYDGDTIVRQWGGVFDGLPLYTAKGIAVSRNKDVYIADSNNKRIMRFTVEGVYQNSYNDVSVPWYVAVDNAGNVYVTYYSLGVIKKFDRFLNFIFSFNSPPNLMSPSFIAIDKISSYIYVYDSASHWIVQFDKNGVFVRRFYGPTGDFLDASGGIDVSRSGDLYVSDGYSLCAYSSTGALKSCMCLRNSMNWDDSYIKGTPAYPTYDNKCNSVWGNGDYEILNIAFQLYDPMRSSQLTVNKYIGHWQAKKTSYSYHGFGGYEDPPLDKKTGKHLGWGKGKGKGKGLEKYR